MSKEMSNHYSILAHSISDYHSGSDTDTEKAFYQALRNFGEISYLLNVVRRILDAMALTDGDKVTFTDIMERIRFSMEQKRTYKEIELCAKTNKLDDIVAFIAREAYDAFSSPAMTAPYACKNTTLCPCIEDYVLWLALNCAAEAEGKSFF